MSGVGLSGVGLQSLRGWDVGFCPLPRGTTEHHGASLPGTRSPDLFELSMQGLNFKSEYWLQFVEPFGDVHPSMQHSQNKNGIPLHVANKKMPVDAMEVQRLMKIRFFSQHFRVVRNSLQCSLDLIEVIVANSIPPGPNTVFLDGDQVQQSLIG